MFDWLRFLNTYGIDYTNRGHSRGNIGIHCPFCGMADHGAKMGISLHGRGWHCWRDERNHTGRAPHRLVMALLGIGYDDAAGIIGADADIIAPELNDGNFLSIINKMLGSDEQPVRRFQLLEFPDTIKPLTDAGVCRSLVYPYLRGRGYSNRGIATITDMFDLHWAYGGPFAYRVVIPVYMDGKLVTWTGRSFAEDEDLRYLSLTTDPAKARRMALTPADVSVKDTLFDYDRLMQGGDELVVTEGPFDAMRVSYYGEDYGIVGTCLFNFSASPRQVALLQRVVDNFRRVTVLFDRTVDGILAVPEYLEWRLRYLPDTVKDPAELNWKQFCQVFDLET